MYYRFSILIAALSIPFWCVSQLAVYDLQVHTEQVEVQGAVETQENKLPEPLDEDVEKRIQVHFSKQGFGISNTERTDWYNFEEKLNFRTDVENRLTEITELYHIADYRLAEAANRKILNEMIQTAAPNSDVFGSRLNEEILFRHVFKAPSEMKSFEQESRGDTLVWSVDGQVVTKYVPGKKRNKGVEVDADMLYRYILYTHEIHPFIAKQISGLGRCPDFLEYTYFNIGQKVTKTVQLSTAHSLSLNTMPVIDQLKIKASGTGGKWHNRLNQLHADLLSNKIAVVDSSAAVAAYEQLKDEGKNLSALLALFDFLLSTGIQPTEQISEIVPLAAEDEQLTAFFAALASPSSDEEAEAHVAVFNELMGQVDEYSYVINVFAANHIQIADENRALNYFELALSENKTIAGVYLDLGNLFCSRYNFDLGWKCYLAAKKLAPNHAMGKDVNQKRKNLEEALPAYF